MQFLVFGIYLKMYSQVVEYQIPWTYCHFCASILSCFGMVKHSGGFCYNLPGIQTQKFEIKHPNHLCSFVRKTYAVLSGFDVIMKEAFQWPKSGLKVFQASRSPIVMYLCSHPSVSPHSLHPPPLLCFVYLFGVQLPQ